MRILNAALALIACAPLAHGQSPPPDSPDEPPALAGIAGAEARDALAAALARREAALSAEAPRLAAENWRRAEELLASANSRLDSADEAGAASRAAEAAALYDVAQLQALKALILTEARSEVVSLGNAGANRFAPKTAERARSLLRQAEAELDADRSRRDAAERLAIEAAREARHAVAIAQFLRQARESDATSEDLVLEWEAALARSAAAAGVTADFSAGPRAAGESLAADIAALGKRAAQQSDDLRQRDLQILALEEEIGELDRRLAGASSEARDAALRLAAQDRARERLAQLERLFAPEQAVVLRQGADIIVRLRGLGFASGSARLTAADEPLLERVGEAVALYPSARVVVEGHTDSTGDSATNQRLSQERAEAVQAYLTQRLQVPAGQVSAIGHGDTRPIARNEDEAGRRENRRIDLLITPPPGALP